MAPTLAERLHARGLRLVGVSSGSTGSAFLLNPRAPSGVGAVVNGYFDPGKTVAYPAAGERGHPLEVRARSAQGAGRRPATTPSVTWTQRVLREYVLPELAPDVVINWLTEPDHSQHHVGVGSPTPREALRHDDAEIASVLASLDGLGLASRTAVLRGLRPRVQHEHRRGRRGRRARRRGAEGGARLDRRDPREQRPGGRAARGGSRPRSHRAHRPVRPGAGLGRGDLHRRAGARRGARRRRRHVRARADPRRQSRARAPTSS